MFEIDANDIKEFKVKIYKKVCYVEYVYVEVINNKINLQYNEPDKYIDTESNKYIDTKSDNDWKLLNDF